jgi:hypothetical protein
MRQGRLEFAAKWRVDAPNHPGWKIAPLLAEAAWLWDELKRLGDKAPGLRDRVEIIDAERALAAFPESPRWRSLLATRSSPMLIEDLAVKLSQSTYRCRAALARAADARSIRILPSS